MLHNRMNDCRDRQTINTDLYTGDDDVLYSISTTDRQKRECIQVNRQIKEVD